MLFYVGVKLGHSYESRIRPTGWECSGRYWT